jgi:hypothetical protein
VFVSLVGVATAGQKHEQPKQAEPGPFRNTHFEVV